MATVNAVVLMGNLTRDPEFKQFENGSVVKFGIASNAKFKSGNEYKEEVTYIDIECWGKQAESINKYCQKGKRVLVQGRLKLDQWEKDGQKRSKLFVSANNVTFLDSPTNSTSSAPSTPAPSSNDEEAPF